MNLQAHFVIEIESVYPILYIKTCLQMHESTTNILLLKDSRFIHRSETWSFQSDLKKAKKYLSDLYITSLFTGDLLA